MAHKWICPFQNMFLNITAHSGECRQGNIYCLSSLNQQLHWSQNTFPLLRVGVSNLVAVSGVFPEPGIRLGPGRRRHHFYTSGCFRHTGSHGDAWQNVTQCSLFLFSVIAAFRFSSFQGVWTHSGRHFCIFPEPHIHGEFTMTVNSIKRWQAAVRCLSTISITQDFWMAFILKCCEAFERHGHQISKCSMFVL